MHTYIPKGEEVEVKATSELIAKPSELQPEYTKLGESETG